MQLYQIAKRELKVGFRNPWAYSFLALFALFSLALLVLQSRAYLAGYTYTTATMLNLILYLLPLMTMLLASFSVTAEKEDGSWQLLATYALSSASLFWGKYVGLAAVLIAIVCFGCGFSGMAGWLLGKGFTAFELLFFLTFSVCLILLYLGIAMLIGALSRNRWQALTLCVSVWFFFILAWPTLLISLFSFLPYTWIKPALQLAICLNPAEFVRIFSVVQLGAGAIFGAEYHSWVSWLASPSGTVGFLLLCVVWIGGTMLAAIMTWERRRYRV